MCVYTRTALINSTLLRRTARFPMPLHAPLCTLQFCAPLHAPKFHIEGLVVYGMDNHLAVSQAFCCRVCYNCSVATCNYMAMSRRALSE